MTQRVEQSLALVIMRSHVTTTYRSRVKSATNLRAVAPLILARVLVPLLILASTTLWSSVASAGATRPAVTTPAAKDLEGAMMVPPALGGADPHQRGRSEPVLAGDRDAESGIDPAAAGVCTRPHGLARPTVPNQGAGLNVMSGARATGLEEDRSAADGSLGIGSLREESR